MLDWHEHQNASKYRKRVTAAIKTYLSSFSCQPLWVGHALKPCPLMWEL